jgi:hypothetical protein
MKDPSDSLAGVLRNHEPEVREALIPSPDWTRAADRFDALFSRMVNPKDSLWSGATLEKLNAVYLAGRGDYQSNITLRTVSAMPAGLRNDTKKIFVQIAEVCTVFNASHKVNFDAGELPEDFVDVPMAPAKKKGFFTYAAPLPALYAKTSLTFDYWVPRILAWVSEIRRDRLSAWRGTAILKHESCTDFMRIALLFLSNPIGCPPVAKAEDRLALLERVFGEPLTWIKKSQKREDILKNNRVIVDGLNRAAANAGLDIPLEAWSRLIPLPFVKGLLNK